MSARILLVDDDRAILRSVERLLSGQGYFVTSSVSAEEAWLILNRETVDLMVLDLSLPGQDGLSFCRRVRARWQFPILMVTARSDSADKVVGLELGADDYLTKPFEPRELLARVRAQLRRVGEYNAAETRPDVIELGRLVIDVDRRDAFLEGRPASLTDREFELLHLLARHRGKAMNKDYLFETVWGYDAELATKALAVYVRRLRQKIEADPDNPRYLLTVRGFGYKLVNPDVD
jgi:two-component system, OmpR family, response regulator VicR